MLDTITVGITLGAVAGLMLVEARWSARHEVSLRRRGAIEAPDDVYRTMRWAYPACFVAMAAEGTRGGVLGTPWWLVGAATFLGAKALKYWAVSALGERWSFRVLVLPGVPPVTSGPYRFVRHPNYVAVVGELVGMALLTGAIATGPMATIGFGMLLLRRIRVEEEMLRIAAQFSTATSTMGKDRRLAASNEGQS